MRCGCRMRRGRSLIMPAAFPAMIILGEGRAGQQAGKGAGKQQSGHGHLRRSVGDNHSEPAKFHLRTLPPCLWSVGTLIRFFMPVFAIRPARPEDAPVILGLLTELAHFEKLPIPLTEQDIERDFFGPRPAIECEIGLADEVPVALVTYYWCYATFRAARRLYLEDFFVQPGSRGRGYGKALLAHLAAKVTGAGAARLEWEVLDWNARAIDLYRRIGAQPHDGWTSYRLEGEALKALAQR